MSIELVQKYLEADAKYHSAQHAMDRAQVERDRALGERGRLHEELGNTVGRNIPHRLWEVDGMFVLVEHVQGPHGSYVSIQTLKPETR
jgi:hypothetical protein